jgi:hypothetical protein
MKRFLPLIGAAVLILATPLMAHAETVSWSGGSGLGSDLLPCSGGEHWVLSDAQAVKSATLVVGGGTYDMQPDGNSGFSADSSGPLVIGDAAVATYDGGGQPSLSLTSCDSSPSPTPDPSPDPSPSPTDSPSPSPPPGGHNGGGTGGNGGTGGTGGGNSNGSPVIHGGGGGAGSASTSTATHSTAAQKKLRDLSATHGPLPAAIHRAFTAGPTQQGDPAPNAGVGGADGALQAAWNDGSSEPFQDARHPPRTLVFVVIAIVAVGIGGAIAARRHLIHATT